MAFEKSGDGFPLIVRAMLAMSRERVLVGIPRDAPKRHEKGALPNPVIGYLMEVGIPEHNVPPRPWLGPGIAYARPQVVATMKSAGVQALKDVAALKATASNGGAVRAGLEQVGVSTRDTVREFIATGDHAPLAPYTLAKRRERGNFDTQPLFDTSQMYRSVAYRLETKKG